MNYKQFRAGSCKLNRINLSDPIGPYHTHSFVKIYHFVVKMSGTIAENVYYYVWCRAKKGACRLEKAEKGGYNYSAEENILQKLEKIHMSKYLVRNIMLKHLQHAKIKKHSNKINE